MIKVNALSKTYDRGRRSANKVLHDVSFQLPDTGFVCILGASGCGKTSLLNAVGGLDRFEGGSISIDGTDGLRYGSRLMEAERNRSFGYIFQNYYLLNEHSVAYNVYLGLHSLDLSHKEKLRRVTEALRAVDMARYARRVVGELSGGQQQRVAIARALARRPRVIFADEPTGNLDEANTLNICTLLRRISKTSLVVMVTHEESIARFFADRIITMADGRISDDHGEWKRHELTVGGEDTIYTGGLSEETVKSDGINLRLLNQQGAEPVDLTIVVTGDRVVVKLNDRRRVICSDMADEPRIVEGERPVLSLETQDTEPQQLSWLSGTDAPARAGGGLGFGMLFSEALRLMREKGLRRVGIWAFLVAVTVLTVFITGDYLTVSSVVPEDFVKTDSHLLEFSFERDVEMSPSVFALQEAQAVYMDWLDASGLDFDYVPHISTPLKYSVDTYLQMGSVSEQIYGFSYVPLSRLDESTLIYGRMPETAEEIVIDRWVLDKFLAQDGIIQSGIRDASYFVGKQLELSKKSYAPTIVGICDSGDPAVYLPLDAFVSLGSAATDTISLSELKALCPGQFDDLELADNECIMITNNAGESYVNRVGYEKRANNNMNYLIVDAVQADTFAIMAISDAAMDIALRQMLIINGNFMLYCEDKAAIQSYLAQGLPEELDGVLRVGIRDSYAAAWDRYVAASHLKADARTIVTFTVIGVLMLMLYLLQRSRVNERMGMIAVYRLLGIPGRKLIAIFALENLMLSFVSALPAAALTWAVISVMTRLESLEFSMVLPWQAALVVYAGILSYQLLVALLPVLRLLCIPPARLAAKYDM